jgi:hypothetical protein
MDREISLEEKIKCIYLEKKNWKKTTKLTSSYLIKGHLQEMMKTELVIRKGNKLGTEFLIILKSGSLRMA